MRLGGDDDLAGALREAAGGGFDVVLDPLWGRAGGGGGGALAPFGRLVAIGQSAGAEATLASRPCGARR